MTIYLRQSTASQEIPLGYFVDSTDGNTEETGLTIANTDIKVWKTGATTLANKNSGGATHISNGIYYAVLDATDTDTLGSLVIFIHVSGALTIRLECLVLPANVYDSLILGSDLLDINVSQFGGTNGTFSSGRPEVKLGNVAHGGSAMTLTAERIIVAATTTNEPAVKLTGNGLGAGSEVNGGDNGAAIQLNGGASGGVGLSIIGASQGMSVIGGTGEGAYFEGGTDSDGISAVGAGAGADIRGDIVGSIQTIGPSGISASSIAANAIGASELAADAVAEIADAIWDEARSGHTTSGTFGEYVNARITGTINTLDTLWSKISKWLQLALRKDTAIATDNATELGEINANGGSGAGAYVSTTDALEAIRDRGDAAWVTGTALDAAGVRAAVGLASANLDTQLADIPTLSELTTEIGDALTVDVIADSVATDGSRPTVAQALLMITRFLMEREVVSTTVTVNKEDGTTSSMTFTLDSATAPTTITRAS